MSLVFQLPPKTEIHQPLIRFTATFNVPTVNRYDFGIAANTNVPFLPSRRNHLFLFERYSFSATVAEAEFFQATQPATTTIPLLSIRIPSQNNRQIHPDPIPLINYVDGLEAVMWAHSLQDENFTATFTGSLAQTAGMGAPATITAQVQFNVYEVSNKDWIENFLGRTRHGQAPGLLFSRGR